jgi:hypothetical protein
MLVAIILLCALPGVLGGSPFGTDTYTGYCEGCDYAFSTVDGAITCGAVTAYFTDTSNGCTLALSAFGGISDLAAAYNLAGGYEGDIATAQWPGCLCMALQTLDGKDYNICYAVNPSGITESCNLSGASTQGNKAFPLCGGSGTSTGTASTETSTGTASTETSTGTASTETLTETASTETSTGAGTQAGGSPQAGEAGGSPATMGPTPTSTPCKTLFYLNKPR